MIGLQHHAASAGFSAAEPARAPRSLYDSYLLHLDKGAPAVREMIISDIRLSRELGAAKQAADMTAVLRAFLSEHPDARPTHPPDAPAVEPAP